MPGSKDGLHLRSTQAQFGLFILFVYFCNLFVSFRPNAPDAVRSRCVWTIVNLHSITVTIYAKDEISCMMLRANACLICSESRFEMMLMMKDENVSKLFSGLVCVIT